jgi:hypothetical protein
MSVYPNIPVFRAAVGPKKPEFNRKAELSKKAELKRLRDLDASQAMKEHEEHRLAVLAKTARLRAERLARSFDVTPPRSLRRS